MPWAVHVDVDVDEGDDKKEENVTTTVRTTLAKGKRQARRVTFDAGTH